MNFILKPRIYSKHILKFEHVLLYSWNVTKTRCQKVLTFYCDFLQYKIKSTFTILGGKKEEIRSVCK